MAGENIYRSKYFTAEEIDQRLLQGYYDDAVSKGFKGSFEDFKNLLAKIQKVESNSESIKVIVGTLQTCTDNLGRLNTTILNYNRKIGDYAPVDKATVVANLGTAVERGMIVTYYTAGGWKSIRYIGSQATAEAFANINNWMDVDDFSVEDTETIVENIEETLVTESLRKTPQVLSDAEKTQVRKNIGAISDKELNELNERINNIKPVIYEGSTINNAPDEEDITSENDVLKLKDRSYGDGMGYVILRKGKSFAEQVTKANTIYEIRYDFDLGAQNVEIPENCTLKFEGGSLRNGSVIGNNTSIDGCINCLTGVTCSGVIITPIRLSWIGIFGTNPSNDVNIKNLANYTKNILELDSNVTLTEGDVVLPSSANIHGNYYTIQFTCKSANNAAIVLSQGVHLSNIRFNLSDESYDKPVILLASELVPGTHSYMFTNIEIDGKWSSTKNYNATGIKIVCSNKDIKEGNYISGNVIQGLRMRFLKVGIDISCINYEHSDTAEFAWLNQLYFNDVYISAKEIGVKTYFVDNGVTNKSDSVGPLYFQNYEFQALIPDAIMFSHDGKWELYINTGYSYDSSYKGAIYNNGAVYAARVPGSYKADGSFEDINGQYKLVDSVKVYSGTYHKDANLLSTLSTYRMGNYSPVIGTQYWQAGADGKAYVIRDGQKLTEKKLYYDSAMLSEQHRINLGNIVNNIKCGKLFGGFGQYSSVNNYGQNRDEVVLDIKRLDTKAAIQNSYGVTEILRGSVTKVYELGTIVEGRIKLSFNVNGESATYTEHTNKYKAINTDVNPLLYINGYTVIDSFYEIVDDELYVMFKAEKKTSENNAAYTFAVTYRRFFSQDRYTVNEEGEMVITDLVKEYFVGGHSIEFIKTYKRIGAATQRPTDAVIGFQYFDTTLNQYITWNGSAWVDYNGNAVNDVVLKKKGMLSERPNAQELHIPIGYMYMWEKTEPDDITGGQTPTGEVIPIWWNGSDWQDTSGNFVASGTIRDDE